MEHDPSGTRSKILRIKGPPIGPGERGKPGDGENVDFLLFAEVEDDGYADGYRVRKIVPVKHGGSEASGPAA